VYVTVLVQAENNQYDYSNQFAPTGANPGNQSLDYVAPWPQKHQYWYGAWKLQLTSISEGVCSLSLAAYQGNASARAALGPVRLYCWMHSNCILQTINPDMAQSKHSPRPHVHNPLRPRLSVAEMTLLHMQRPLLSSLLSLGASAGYPGRLLVWKDLLCADEPYFSC
jgi:hypothetical protein